MDTLIVVDMQVGLQNGDKKHDLQGVVDRINALARMVRDARGKVIWIQHCGSPGGEFERHTAGWVFLPNLNVLPTDIVVEKQLNDPFAGTSLQNCLNDISPDRLLITGWATDFCVDATVRSAVSNNYHVVVVSDGHTLSDRPHLSALSVIEHHNWVWSRLLTKSSVDIKTTAELFGEGG